MDKVYDGLEVPRGGRRDSQMQSDREPPVYNGNVDIGVDPGVVLRPTVVVESNENQNEKIRLCHCL
jgi:hypothetical protein